MKALHLYSRNNAPPVFAPVQQRRRREVQNTNSDVCGGFHFDIVSEVRQNHTYYNTSVSSHHNFNIKGFYFCRLYTYFRINYCLYSKGFKSEFPERQCSVTLNDRMLP